jgi:hypothetical protein
MTVVSVETMGFEKSIGEVSCKLHRKHNANKGCHHVSDDSLR